MKKISFLKKVIILSMFTPIAGCSPEDTQEACDIKHKADVLLNFVKPVLNNLASDQTKQVYDVSFNLLNSIAGIVCSNPNVETTPSFGFNYKVMYSATDPNVTNGSKEKENTTPHPPLPPNKDIGAQKEEIVFNKNGYYAFETYADNSNQVVERDENNNIAKKSLVRSNSSNDSQTTHSFVIHVQGITNPDIKFDADGKPILVEILKSSFQYK